MLLRLPLARKGEFTLTGNQVTNRNNVDDGIR